MTPHFDPAVLAPDPRRRGLVLDVLRAALNAVDPADAVHRHLGRRGDKLVVGGTALPLPTGGVIVLAFGKAAVPMARATIECLEGVPVRGVIVGSEPTQVCGLEMIRAAHPLPDESSVFAGRRLLELASEAGSGDLIIVLISGGGSSLVEVPAADLDLADIAVTNEALLRSGAGIDALNTVRKHISAIKGGRLAEAAAPARLVTLAVSDVVGGSLTTIASGPTVPDPSTFGDALAIVERHELEIPKPVLRHLHAGRAGRHRETPKRGDVFDRQVFQVIAGGADAAEAARAAATAHGITASVETTTMIGEAREVGAVIARQASRLDRLHMFIHAGETTVTVTGDGVGGRNQELALAAAIELEGDTGTLVASLGTDGVDGPTDAAGAVADGMTLSRGGAKGLDAAAALANNDSSVFLSASGDLLRCGPTGTNVGDLVLAIHHPC